MHEGDWEEIAVALNATGQPVAAAASQHNLGVMRRWGLVRKSGTHPHVYVALGSHANYFRPGRHRIPQSFSGLPLPEPDFTSTEVTRQPAVTDISDGKAPWLSFAGAWGDGSFVLLGATSGGIYAHLHVGGSPSGPAQHDVWKDPLLAFLSWPADDGH
jgi:hypothetical protein